eukprot:m51a1_g5953 hypothetical protein (107) ;mRNA; r:141584-142114
MAVPAVVMQAPEGGVGEAQQRWVMLELQGDIEFRALPTPTSAAPIGTLSLSQDLHNPLLVVQRGDQTQAETGEKTRNYEVLGVIREKIVFKQRPRSTALCRSPTKP